MGIASDLYRGTTNIDFRPLWRRSVQISAAMLVISVLSLAGRGVNLSIDFEGGGKWEVPVPSTITVADGRDAVGIEDARVQILGGDDSEGGNLLRVQSSTAEFADNTRVVTALAELAGVDADQVKVDTVGPTWGSQITGKALRALLLFFLVVAAYLASRLEWRMSVGALVAVVHDLVITAGVYSVTGFEVSPATVIALLTIMGYSIYDTVVVYDKVLENQASPLADGVDHTELINRSMNHVVMRSINTTITTVLPVLSMLVVGGVLLGGDSLRGFALALFVGLILGTYSSIFLAAPTLAWLKEREPETDEYRRRRRRVAETSGAESSMASVPVGSKTDEEPEQESVTEPDSASNEKFDGEISVSESGAGAPVIVPRGRKKRRR